jgi:hypothetical protein
MTIELQCARPLLQAGNDSRNVTEKVHQEVLRGVFGPATSFDKPLLDFANAGLACLVKFGIKSVVWETPDCSKGLVCCVLKPLENADQEAVLEFLGMLLHNIICLSLY